MLHLLSHYNSKMHTIKHHNQFLTRSSPITVCNGTFTSRGSSYRELIGALSNMVWYEICTIEWHSLGTYGLKSKGIITRYYHYFLYICSIYSNKKAPDVFSLEHLACKLAPQFLFPCLDSPVPSSVGVARACTKGWQIRFVTTLPKFPKTIMYGGGSFLSSLHECNNDNGYQCKTTIK